MHATVNIIDVQDYFPSQQRRNSKFTAVVRQNMVALNGIRQQYGRIMLCGCLILLKCKYWVPNFFLFSFFFNWFEILTLCSSVCEATQAPGTIQSPNLMSVWKNMLVVFNPVIPSGAPHVWTAERHFQLGLESNKSIVSVTFLDATVGEFCPSFVFDRSLADGTLSVCFALLFHKEKSFQRTIMACLKTS